jgi:hypothetical protein
MKSRFIQNNPIKGNITDIEGGGNIDDAPEYDDNRDQLKFGYKNSSMSNNFNNPYNQVKIPEITTNEEYEEVVNNPDKLLQYSIANFKRRVNKYNSSFSSTTKI